jgi:IS4 transposase
VAGVYKERWQIDIFFKAIKQNLKMKRFYGNSKNAVMTQVWIALTAYLFLPAEGEVKEFSDVIYQLYFCNKDNALSMCFSF